MRGNFCWAVVLLVGSIGWGRTQEFPVTNLQPYLVINQVIVTDGSRAGEIVGFAGDFAPSGSLIADGSVLAIADNSALFNAIGATYGGDGVTTFALPDLRGRAITGAGTGADGVVRQLGSAFGSATYTVGTGNLPVSQGGSAAPIANASPTLALTNGIYRTGFFPIQGSGGGGAPNPTIGQIVTTARADLPSGALSTDGSLLPVAGNETFSAVLGTAFGGDGVTDFAIPDLRGGSVLGAVGGGAVGTTLGSGEIVLTLENLPPGRGGSGVPVSNVAPGLNLFYGIAVGGLYPTRDGASLFEGDDAILGQISLFAGQYVPRGFVVADGASLLIQEKTALYSVIQGIYGGDDVTEFNVPNLANRQAVGTGMPDIGLLGESFGESVVELMDIQVPVAPVPEPGAFGWLVVAALGAVVGARRAASRRRAG